MGLTWKVLLTLFVTMIFPILLSLFFYVSQISVTTATTALPSPIRIAFFVTRNPNITEEEFHYHWSTHHAPLVTPWLMKSGVLEYNQVCLPLISSPSVPFLHNKPLD
jgi:hypothetical protein